MPHLEFRSSNNTHLLNLFCLLIFCVTSKGQVNLKEAKVKLNDDTTKDGFIDYKEWFRNPIRIKFYSTKNSNPTEYNVEDIKSFEVKGLESYDRYKVRISLSGEKFTDNITKDTTTKIQNVLLKVQVKGYNVNLFSYRDDIKQRWYLQTNSNPFELLNSAYQTNDGLAIYQKEYQDQLQSIANSIYPNNLKLLQRIERVTYTRKGLIRICYQLNGLSETESKEATNKHGSLFRWMFGAGLNNSVVKISGTHRFEEHQMTAQFAALNVGFDIVPIPTVARLYVRSSVGFTGFNVTSSTQPEDYGSFTQSYHMNLKQLNIPVGSQLIYSVFKKENYYWSLGAGAFYNTSWYPVNNETQVTQGNINQTVVKENYIDSPKRRWIFPSIRTSFGIRQFEISANYSFLGTISYSNSYNIGISGLNVSLNYIFK